MSSGHEESPPPAPPPPARTSPALVAAVFAVLLGGAVFTALRAVLPGKEAVRHGHGGDPAGAPLPAYAEVPPFSLVERSGRTVTREDLLGKFWVADFIFTNCAGICPEMSTRMTAVHEAFRRDPDALCVSITVDPDRDTPEVLREYAAKYGASPDRWLYLRGPVKDVLALSYEGFRIGDAEDPLIHSQRFVLVDRQGRIRGYYRGTEKEEVERLMADYRALRAEAPPPGRDALVELSDLPLLNASLNAASFVALMIGWRFAKARRFEAHRAAMLTAVSFSALFLVSYVVYHVGKEGVVTRFPVGGWPKVLYLSVLLTHTPLAAALLPLIGVAVFHAFKGNFEKHRRVVRWTLPVWSYVSVTGVAVYVMLYRIDW